MTLDLSPKQLQQHDIDGFGAQREVVAPCEPLTVAGLFAGIGGIELGLSRAGHKSIFMCEIDDGARVILEEHFQGTELVADVRDVDKLPDADLLAAGFPCQDLSQAGRMGGIGGKQSGLVGEVFRLLKQRAPQWLLLENVPFMLALDRGEAMTYLTKELERLGYTWAYRVIDTRSFGLPQRRQRVILLASRTRDPREILFADNVQERDLPETGDAFGFYWTEGNRGVGWGIEAIPPLKKGSAVGIPSSPAIWLPKNECLIGTLDIRDAERLQGFDVDWTEPAVSKGGVKERVRWSYVGNAVTVALAEWLGRRLLAPGDCNLPEKPLPARSKWPRAAWGKDGEAFEVTASIWPVDYEYQPLSSFLDFELVPLSKRATAGFLSRALRSNLRFQDGFLDALRLHLERTSK